MPDVTYTVSVALLGRMRDAVVRENPALQGQSNAVLNEAVRVRGRQLIKDWLVANERSAASTAAYNGVSVPGDSDIN